MPVQLRKRKAPQPPPAPAPAAKKKKPKAAKAKTEKAEPEEKKGAKASKTQAAAPPAAASAAAPAIGDIIPLDAFGGTIETNEGEKTSLKKLLDSSKSGLVLFTYPKASTPGCTTQVCLFRDAYDSLTADGLSIYGLSSDSPKANTSFREKQKLPYPLLCDPSATLIAAIGLKKQPRGTQRGVFAVDKDGKVLVAEAGGPAATLERVKQLVAGLKKQ